MLHLDATSRQHILYFEVLFRHGNVWEAMSSFASLTSFCEVTGKDHFSLFLSAEPLKIEISTFFPKTPKHEGIKVYEKIYNPAIQTNRSMKRERIERTEEPMGATELSFMLSGNDPGVILEGLRRFVRIVKEERSLALGLTEEEEVDDEDDDTRVDSQQSKRLKPDEKWKEDTAAYNVPFVGTSVSVKDKGKIVKNQWPTGLLAAYLEKSPQATELTGDHLVPGVGHVSKTLIRQKQHKMNSHVGKAYFRALSELISSEIPINKLRDETVIDSNTTESNPSSIVSIIVKQRLGTFFNILKSETGEGKGLSGPEGGCGPLVVEVLDILTMLSLTSTTTARHIARSMEQKLPELVQRFLVRMPHRRSQKITARDRARAAAMRFVSVLLNHSDSVIISCIVSSGHRERKVPPGILYLVCRDGFSLPKDLLSDPKTMFAQKLSLILKVMVEVLFESRDLVSNRMLLDLISKEFVDAIVNLATLYPFPEDFNAMGMFVRTDANVLDPLRCVAQSAQAIIARLLLDRNASPILTGLGAQNASGSKHCMYLTVRMLNAILDQSATLSTNRFVIHCLNKSPRILGSFFTIVNLPGPKDNDFNVVKRVHFFCSTLQHGPSLHSCMQKEQLDSAESLTNCIAPVAIRKAIMTNLLRGKNHLILSEVLRFCLCAIKRVQALISTGDLAEVAEERIIARLKQQLPELSVLISVTSSFGAETKQKNRIVFYRVLEVLRLSGQVIPSWLSESAFDYAKILPSTSQMLNFPVFLQHKMLATLSEAVALHGESLCRSQQAMATLLDLLIKTPQTTVYQKCRKILVSILSARDINNGWSSSLVRHEASCWLDGMNESCVPEFLEILKISASVPDVMPWIECTKAWESTSERASSSPLISICLIEALKKFEKASFEFKALTIQVASRALLFQPEPREAALLLVHLLRKRVQTTTIPHCGKPLENLCQSLIDKDTLEKRAIVEFLESLCLPGAFFSTFLGKEEMKGNCYCQIETDDFGIAMQYLSNIENLRGVSPFFDSFSQLVPPLLLSHNSFIWDAKQFLRVAKQRMTQWEPNKAQSFLLSLSHCNQGLQDCSLLVPQVDDGELPKALLLYMWLPSLGLDITVKEVSHVIGDSSYREAFRVPILCSLLDRFASLYSGKGAEEEGIESLLKSLVELWTDIAIDSSLLMSCQNAMSKVIKYGAPTSSSYKLLKHLEEMGAKEVISRALDVQIAGNGNVSGSSLPWLLLNQDYVLYGSAFFSAWVKGDLQIQAGESNIGEILQTCLLALQRWDNLKLNKSTKQTISKNIALLPCEEPFVEIVVEVILCLEPEDLAQLDSSLFRLLEERAHDLLGHIDDFSSDARIKVLEHCLQMLKASSLRDPDANKKRSALESLFLQTFTSCIDRSLRSFKKASNSSRSKRVRVMHDLFHTYWQLPNDDDSAIGEEKFPSLMMLVKTCVKYGMGGEPQDSLLWCGCLELVGLILPSVARAPVGIMGASSVCSTIFQWITSHSSFSSVITQDSPSSKSILLRILLFCLQNAIDISFEVDVWSSVLNGYGAGLSESDSLSRTFMNEYRACSPSGMECCYMDEMRWGSEAGSQVLDDPWDWLPSWIELPRVLATLRHFPLNDTYDPARPLLPSESSANSIICTSQMWTTHDKRYSPGFLLPIVASALEQRISGDRMMKGSLLFSTPQFVQKLSQRGTLALALASLCSQCSTIRKLGMASLYFALVVIDSDEAKNLPFWRDRPQLSLLLRSVQRALALTISEDRSENIPVIDPPCAIFLAKASILLSTPGDELYPSINRYFLRIGDNHGALNDLRRQPAFVTLFCSANTDEATSMRERCWAVETLGDSFIHEKCFGPLMSCHALEMLLTRLESIGDSPNDVEYHLILSALTRIVTNCGQKGASEMLERAGLLSWLISQITARRVLDRDENPALFVNLLCTVMMLDGVKGRHDILLLLKRVPEILIQKFNNSSVHSRLSLDAITQFFTLHQKLLSDAGNRRSLKAEISTRLLEGLVQRLDDSRYLVVVLGYLANIELEVQDDCTKLLYLILKALQKVDDASEETCCTALQCILDLLTLNRPVASSLMDLSDRLISLRPLCSTWGESRKQWELLFSLLMSH